jgi:hypothetical protein
MDASVAGDHYHYGELDLRSINVNPERAIEVTFSNRAATRIMDINRVERILYGANFNRRFFMRAMFDRFNDSTTPRGLITTFAPTLEYFEEQPF